MMNRLLLISILLHCFTSVFGQKENVLIHIEEDRPLIIYSDPLSRQVDTIIFKNDNINNLALFIIDEVLPFHFKGTLYLETPDEDFVSHSGFVEKTDCFGFINADTYIATEDGRQLPYVRLFSEPSLKATYILLEVNSYDFIEAIPIDFVDYEDKYFSKVLFIYKNQLMEGYVTRLCTQFYTTCT